MDSCAIRKKAALFVLLGQSNATGYAVPMREEDRILHPLKNVFGLHRRSNQSYDSTELTWSGYTSHGMNLAEEYDNSYSVANCLATLWQEHIDGGNRYSLPDLYIIQISIGAQGVTERYMWHPAYEKRLIPGPLGTADISLLSFTAHILSLVPASFEKLGLACDPVGIHWRGGENDMAEPKEVLENTLEPTYREIFGQLNALSGSAPIVLHRIVCHDRAYDLDPTGFQNENIHYINGVFEKLCASFANVSMFDPRKYPGFIPGVYGNGLFIGDAVHFTEDANRWTAKCILEEYAKKTTSIS